MKQVMDRMRMMVSFLFTLVPLPNDLSHQDAGSHCCIEGFCPSYHGDGDTVCGSFFTHWTGAKGFTPN
jgi:hypothetical protein